MRQIVLDTETTGLEPSQGHRVIEIGCVELINRQFTGNTFHKYINPERKVENDAIQVHGITDDFLKGQPLFREVLPEFLKFITGAEVIAHNAPFDINFLNHEIRLVSEDAKLLDEYITVFDTLTLARKKFPGQRNTLDAVCKRYKIDLTTRKLQGHGALLDAKLLAEAYLAMTAAGQSSLFAELEEQPDTKTTIINNMQTKNLLNGDIKNTPVITAKNEELAEHTALLEKIMNSSKKYLWLENEEK